MYSISPFLSLMISLKALCAGWLYTYQESYYISQMKKLRVRELNILAQGFRCSNPIHTTQNWDSFFLLHCTTAHRKFCVTAFWKSCLIGWNSIYSVLFLLVWLWMGYLLPPCKMKVVIVIGAVMRPKWGSFNLYKAVNVFIWKFKVLCLYAKRIC